MLRRLAALLERVASRLDTREDKERTELMKVEKMQKHWRFMTGGERGLD